MSEDAHENLSFLRSWTPRREPTIMTKIFGTLGKTTRDLSYFNYVVENGGVST